LAEGTTTPNLLYNYWGDLTADQTYAEEIEFDDNLRNALSHPFIFYMGNESPSYDWYGKKGSNNSLWNTPAGGKNPMFDPCPTGWRVPNSSTGTASIWRGLSAVGATWNLGYQFPGNGYYPASGGYDFSSGKLAGVGTSGFVWSATPTGTRAFLLSFQKDLIYPSSSAYRASGYPVRCVKERPEKTGI
jgi:hypothetical protein